MATNSRCYPDQNVSRAYDQLLKEKEELKKKLTDKEVVRELEKKLEEKEDNLILDMEVEQLKGQKDNLGACVETLEKRLSEKGQEVQCLSKEVCQLNAQGVFGR